MSTDTDVIVVESDTGDTIVVEVFTGMVGPAGPAGPPGPPGATVGTNEVMIATTDPGITSEIELWYDPDAVPIGPAVGADEVVVQTADPGITSSYELWYDPDAVSTRRNPRVAALENLVASQATAISQLEARIAGLEQGSQP